MVIHKNKIYLWIICICLGCSFFKSALSITSLPEGCVSLSNIEQTLNINTKTPQLILLYNNSTHALWLNTPLTIAHLSSQRWSALVINQLNFSVKCIEIKPGAEQYIPCHRAIQACSYNKADFTDKNSHSHWIVQDEASLSSLTRKIQELK